ncbi:Gfo/Idh/MocA family oxidoreductase [Rhizobium sp. VS19-DR104.2]|uniref:Gfo/Idh/MocA family oxidoreductase n=1 Tax=unclassified Rhizobium TaxID=2613769 RepID=UPI001CC5D3B8|nr:MULTISPECIES: Gfo/Idh/MocA family oxidoreductase [unclassified Rhizobium]MBZ5763748.1 Gfo/Idh/MocA family oxidoreductase [Rhizobium sp. VS19-DR96]MBZ5769610.1 Gfo/Idh/MocA family oxidoreductase [Rhizobium sp. VS19-DR129.2]MBZ5776368.1 Gfo/Idh/MocA family oxidoreductase [Rhizobium sp. VS19-DRK62.2]MBZ5787575.1 Gfo/Idh/MocA family oxidoreductase [Rhizobium sp. VS19-DR121]MBZ5804930.1 Gfo/Idh/MocA family oxidoreductase [Rhizobium sp. VS19-DR181]
MGPDPKGDQDRNFKIALIGAGEIGRLHAENISATTGMELAGIVDIDEARAALFRSDYHCDISTSLRELTATVGVDSVLICTPEKIRVEIVEEAIEYNLPIFLEKPLSRRLEEGLELYQKLVASRLPFQIGFQRRFDQEIANAKLRVKSASHLEYFRSLTRDPQPPAKELGRAWGGIACSTLIHDIDSAHFLCGAIKTVYAVSHSQESELWEDADNIVVAVEFESGTLGTLEAHWNAGYGYDSRIELMVKGESIRTSGVSADGVCPSNFQDRFQAAYIAELQSFKKSVQMAIPCSPGLDEAISAQIVVEAINISLQNKSAVVVRNVNELYRVAA